MRAAVYARVSTGRQERQQTIDSQLSALRDWARAQGHALAEAHVFRDEGYSGSRLDRPGLDGLRDAVHEGAVDVVAVFSPDRLARKYAYQILLLEEFQRANCEIAFLHRPISDDPNDQLLLQIQGAVAEYERAVLAERFRRGKLQKARDGHVIAAKAAYGYSYEPRRGAVPARLVVDEAEAAMVRQIYAWVGEDGLTIRQCMRRLNDGPWVTRSGRALWSSSVVHHIMSDPIYTGTAYVNRFAYVAPSKPRSRSRRAGERTCRRPRPPEQWIGVPVPPLVDQDVWDGVQARLARNAALSFRRNKQQDYLLRCLVKCGTCGLGIHGCFFPGKDGRVGRRYYRCAGTDSLNAARETRCPRVRIEADGLERAVWDHVAGLLGDPAQLLAQFEAFVLEGAADERDEAARSRFQQRLDRLDRADQRLLAAYQAEVISLDELSDQRRALAGQRRVAEQQREQHQRLRAQRLQAQATMASLSAFSAQVCSRLDAATTKERQALLQLVVERIIVHDDTLEIQHVIPLRGPGPGTEPIGSVRLRSDGVGPARGLEDRRGLALAEIQLAITSIGVGLKHADPAGEVSLRVLAPSVGREVEQSRRGIGTAEGTVVAHVDPHASRGGLALGQHRYGGVVAVQAPSRHDMRFDEPEQRLQHRRAGAHLIGQRRQAEGHALTGIALGLAVQRLVLAVLLEQHHGEQARAGPPARHGVEGRRHLGNVFAGAAGEALTHRLDHGPAPRHHFQRLGDVLAHLRQALPAAARADGWARYHEAHAGQVRRKGLARRLPPFHRGRHRGPGGGFLGRESVGGRRSFEFLEL